MVGAIIPWIVFILIILLLIFGLYKFFGMQDKAIWDTIGGPILIYVIILIVILIGIVAVFEPQVSPFAGENGTIENASSGVVHVEAKSVRSEALSSLTHPRVLGAIFILIISAFTVKILVDKPE